MPGPATELKTLRTTFEVKAVLPEQRIIEGFCAVGGNLDRVGDIIDPAANVKAAQTPVGDIGVFIGHQSSDLPLGRCLELRAQPGGLWTKTYIFPTTRGDDLLITAKALQDTGSSLGMSIGYRTDDFAYERRDSKMARVIKSYQLAEYSYAAKQVIANPRALVTGVKSQGEKLGAPGTFDAARMALMCCLRDQFPDAWAEIEDIYPDRVIYSLTGSGGLGRAYYQSSYSLDASGEATLGDPTEMSPNWTIKPRSSGGDMGGMDMGKTTAVAPEEKAVWSASYVNDLEDRCFLDIESGGAKDDEGKTVPRSLRHFPYRDADGKLDAAHLRNAIARIPQASYDGLDDAKKARLQAKARRLLEGMSAGKTAAELETREWDQGAAIQLWEIAYGLRDSAEQAAGEFKAMSLLGTDTKSNQRLRPELRQKLADLAGQLTRLVEHAERIDRGQDGAAHVASLRSQLALLEV